MLSALSLWRNNLVSKLLSLYYVAGIVILSLHLSPCLDMVHLETPFASCIAKCGQPGLYVLLMLKVQALNRQQIFSFWIVVGMSCNITRFIFLICRQEHNLFQEKMHSGLFTFLNFYSESQPSECYEFRLKRK